jgi:hypothetical protein
MSRRPSTEARVIDSQRETQLPLVGHRRRDGSLAPVGHGLASPCPLWRPRLAWDAAVMGSIASSHSSWSVLPERARRRWRDL